MNDVIREAAKIALQGAYCRDVDGALALADLSQVKITDAGVADAESVKDAVEAFRKGRPHFFMSGQEFMAARHASALAPVEVSKPVSEMSAEEWETTKRALALAEGRRELERLRPDFGTKSALDMTDAEYEGLRNKRPSFVRRWT